MKDVCFVSVVVGRDQRYVAQQDRLRESILGIYPDANLMFWRGELPPGAKAHEVSFYGFKVHAIEEARKQFSKIIWVDAAIVLAKPIVELFNYEVAAAKDDNLLCNFISDGCLANYGLDRNAIKEKEWHLIGGSLYYFDFSKQIANDVFSQWHTMENNGLFGSYSEESTGRLQGHRHDEACLAVSMYMNGIEPLPSDAIGYNTQNNPTFPKYHFK